MKKADDQKIKEILTRGVEQVFPSLGAVEKILAGGRKLKIYYGIDPTGKSLHLGHLIQLRKLRDFQKLGHEIIILLGDFTAQIGDPTDKMAARKPLTHKQVLANAKDYKKQIARILDIKSSRVRFLRNEKWTNKLKPVDLLEIASHFTTSQLLSREMFQKRIKDGKDIHVHEFLYPIFQAYDSVTMNVDMEIGGNDQMFNMLAGRDLVKKMLGKEKIVLTTRLLVDHEGKKMGKTEGNMVNLSDSPNDMFGKIMSWPDGLIVPGLELLTDIPMAGVDSLKKDLGKNANPRDIKFKLAMEIVRAYYGDGASLKAGEAFNRIFRDKKTPKEMKEVKIKSANLPVVELLRQAGIVQSNNEARRLIEQGGLKIDNARIGDFNASVGIYDGLVIQAGRHRFVRVKRG
ncbi:tyrosine--tRNA ligase [Candidatus Microgenomates bacterium]|nr:tyrosine--tRNA ligase [Candidatus Microgenomates bacterium]